MPNTNTTESQKFTHICMQILGSVHGPEDLTNTFLDHLVTALKVDGCFLIACDPNNQPGYVDILGYRQAREDVPQSLLGLGANQQSLEKQLAQFDACDDLLTTVHPAIWPENNPRHAQAIRLGPGQAMLGFVLFFYDRDVPFDLPEDLLLAVSLCGTMLLQKISSHYQIDELSKALETQRGMAKGIVDSSLNTIIASDARGVIKMVNPITEKMFGYTRDELLGNNVRILMTQGNAVHHDQYLKHYISGGEPKIIGTGREVVAKRKDGTEFPIFLSLAHFTIAGESHFAASIHDMSQRHEVLKDLDKARDEAEQYFETAATPILVLSNRGDIILLNKAASKLLEITTEAAIGVNYFEKFHVISDNLELFDKFDDVVNSGISSEDMIAAEMTSLAGNVVKVEWRLAPFRGQSASSDEAVKAVILSGIDVTDMKHAEEELLQSQKLQALGLLTGGIAHDFNNLLAVIQGNATLLLEDIEGVEGQLKSEMLESAESIAHAAKRGVSLTSRLLLFSRKKTMKMETVVVHDLLYGLKELLARTIGEEIELNITSDDNAHDCEVNLNPAELENAILNLAINARDAMDGKGILEIALEKVDVHHGVFGAPSELKDGSYALIEVIDSGTGITTDVLDKIFDPFFTTKSVDEGSGLGLSMVFGFARQSGGTVTVSTELGEGSTFRIWLPINEMSLGRDVVMTAEDEEPLRHGSETILMVEDEATVRMIISRHLRRLGYRVITAESAVEAHKMIVDGQDFDLLLTDMVLPGGMSGNDLRKRIQKEMTDKPIIMMSGYSKELDQIMDEQTEGFRLLEKPFDMDVLMGLFEELLPQKEE